MFQYSVLKTDMYVHVHRVMYVYKCTCVYIYIYIYQCTHMHNVELASLRK